MSKKTNKNKNKNKLEKPMENKSINKEDLKALEISLNQKDAELVKKESAIIKRIIDVEKQELQAKHEFPEMLEKEFNKVNEGLKSREDELLKEREFIEKEKDKLRQREQSIKTSEIERDHGFQDERIIFEGEISEKRKKIEAKVEKEKEHQISKMENEISDEKARLLKIIKDELDADIRQKKEELIKREKKLNDREGKVADLEFEREGFQRKKSNLLIERESIATEIEEGISDRRKSFEKAEVRLKDENDRLRGSLDISEGLISNFENLKHELGGKHPAEALRDINSLKEENKKVLEDLLIRPTQETLDSLDRIRADKEAAERIRDEYKDKYNDVVQGQRDQDELKDQIDDLESKLKRMSEQKESVEVHNNQQFETIKRLQATYEREADREARIKDIELAYIQEIPDYAETIVEDQQNYEIEWLDNIQKSCSDYGLQFSQRILYAFHTALKTSEWSPITVLAGVSGTGKSELPKLYSHFGGINFLALSVQPNWDSQESMLGFFNSIDNKFDAQPVLRFLSQTQKEKTDEYELGLRDSVNIVLMDEMNLAHVELYFADFLSKLEQRRGKVGSGIPKLEVKLGAGIEPYELTLGRNVLWAGTMNQDETTKTLSDKVLDRGTVINFPRPTKFERRQLEKIKDPSPLLHRALWNKWLCFKSSNIFSDEQILPYKRFVEEMNESLSKVGRALGHRVWQSIEYYMANYPTVLEAHRNKDEGKMKKVMKIAFEDQLVQKVMPKLRGIETRGKSRDDCLDPIRAQLDGDNYSIVGDFDAACEFGYGQFIWSSADYLNSDTEVEDSLVNESGLNTSGNGVGDKVEKTESKNTEEQETNSSQDNNEDKAESEQSDSKERDLSQKDKNMKVLVKYAYKEDKELYQLTKFNIMEALNDVGCKFTPQEINSLKIAVNETKER